MSISPNSGSHDTNRTAAGVCTNHRTFLSTHFWLIIDVPGQKFPGGLCFVKNSHIRRGHLVRNSHRWGDFAISAISGTSQLSGSGAVGANVSPRSFRKMTRG